MAPAVLTSTYLQIGAIFGLFAMLPFVRELFTGQCEGKECICVVRDWVMPPGGQTALQQHPKRSMRCFYCHNLQHKRENI